MKILQAAFGFGILVATSAVFGFEMTGKNSFGGVGSWKTDSGATGEYRIRMEWQNDSWCSFYEWNTESSQFCLSPRKQENGFFLLEGGWGYCLSHQCHYQIEKEGFILEETITHSREKLYKIGSKIGAGGTKTIWEETLQLEQ